MSTEATPPTGTHPLASSLSAPTYERMIRDQRVLRGEWDVEDWLWEEVRQLNALIIMLNERRSP